MTGLTQAGLKLAGRAGVVTGAGGGIGRALAVRAARAGLRPAICDVSAAGLAETERLVAEFGVPAVSAVVDVRRSDHLAAFAERVDGAIALVFANAGVLRPGAVADQPIEDLRLMLEVNVIGVVQTVQAFLPRLKAQAEPSRIVITGSQASFLPYPDLGGYCAGKHALAALAAALSAELAAQDAPVAVSLLAPGAVATGIFGAQASPNLATSLSPDAVADLVFDAIARDVQLISTHPGLADKLDARVAALKAQMG